jgi:pyruvate-formate lyase-activating enzyme
MNIYHITYSPQPKIACLHFWGCNLSCRACLCHKEIYDCHLEETKDAIFQPNKVAEPAPKTFLAINQVQEVLRSLEMQQVILMGQEPTIDPELPELAKELHIEFGSYNILLTNGFKLLPMVDFDEVVFSIKAYTDSLHRDYTGKSNQEALDNFLSIYKSGVKLRAESICIPEYIEHNEVDNIARFIAQIDKNIPYRVDAYLPVAGNPWRRPSVNEMKAAVTAARRYLNNVSCLTGNEELKYKVIRIV